MTSIIQVIAQMHFCLFFEACTIEQLPAKNILRALNYYIGTPRLYSVADDYQHLGSRTVFMRSVSIKLALKKNILDHSRRNHTE